MRKNLILIWNSEFKYLIQFADDNNIAVITWTNFGGYLISTSSDEMTENNRKDYDYIFNDRLSEWETGFRRALHKYNLPRNATMLYDFPVVRKLPTELLCESPTIFRNTHSCKFQL